MKRFFFSLGVLLIFFLLGVTLFQKTDRIDLDIIIRAANHLSAGQPVYDLSDTLEHTKIPLVTLYFIPLAKLGSWWASRIWDILTVLAYPSLVFYLARRLNLTETVRQKTLVLLTLLLTLNPWNTEVWTGQMNVLLWIAIMAAGSTLSSPFAGACLAAALLAKPPYLIFLPWVLRQSPNPKRLVAWAAGAVTLSAALYTWVFGWNHLIADHITWIHFLPLSSKKHLGIILNYGLPSLTRSYAGASEFWLLAGLLAAEWISRSVRQRYTSASLIALLVVVCSPMAWFQNFTLSAGFVLLLISDFCETRDWLARAWLGLGIAALFMSFPMMNPEVLRHTAWGPVFYYGNRIPLFGVLIASFVWSTYRFASGNLLANRPLWARI